MRPLWTPSAPRAVRGWPMGSPVRSQRQARVLRALRHGPLMREQLDKVAGASNGPHVVLELRRLGYKIHCERIKMPDRDGRICLPGRYSLQDEQRPHQISMPI